MSVKDLKDLLEHLEDTREIVLHDRVADRGRPAGELYDMWRDAREEARCAYADWAARGGAGAYAVYLAAEDRADAAAAGWAGASSRQTESLP